MDTTSPSSRSRWLLILAVVAALVVIPLALKTATPVPATWGPTLAPLNRAFNTRWKQRFLELHIHSVETTCMTDIDPQVCYVARDAHGKTLGAFRTPTTPVPSFENYAAPRIVFYFVRQGVAFDVHSPLLQPVVAPTDAERVLDDVLSGLIHSVETRNANVTAWTANPDETGMCVRVPENPTRAADATKPVEPSENRPD